MKRFYETKIKEHILSHDISIADVARNTIQANGQVMPRKTLNWKLNYGRLYVEEFTQIASFIGIDADELHKEYLISLKEFTKKQSVTKNIKESDPE